MKKSRNSTPNKRSKKVTKAQLLFYVQDMLTAANAKITSLQGEVNRLKNCLQTAAATIDCQERELSHLDGIIAEQQRIIEELRAEIARLNAKEKKYRDLFYSLQARI